MKLLPLLLALVALPAAAEFVVVEETETMTEYRDGDHVIVLLEDGRSGQIVKFMRARALEQPVGTTVHDDAAREAGVKLYWSRFRLLDGDVVCEKVAPRPAPERRQYVLGVLTALPCRTGLF